MIKINDKSISSVYDETTSIDKILKGTLLVYDGWKKLIANGVPPLTLQKCKGVDLVDYKIYGDSVQKLLPSEYQEVEYIESTGGQYINTGFMPNQNSAVEIYGNQIYRESNSLFGVNPYFVITSGSGKYRFRYNNTTIDTTITANTLVKIALKKNEAYINDELIGTFEVSEFQTTHNAILFGRISSSGSVEEHKASRIYYAKIWDNDVLVRHFIPCYRKSDNVIGMYDIINKTFYENEGTGDFLKGNDTSSLPTPDTPIEVESVGDRTNNLLDESLLGQEEGYNIYENGMWTTSSLGSYGRDLFYNRVGVNHSVDVTKVPKVNPNTTITIKFHDYVNNSMTGNNPLYCHIFNNEGTYISRKAFNPVDILVMEVPEDGYCFNFSRVNNVGTISFSHIQIVEGSYTATTMPDYEPYGYKIPVKVTPNIYNYEEFFSVSGTAQSIAVSKINFDSINIYQRYQNIFVIPNTLFKPNTTYEISKTLKVISGTSQYNTSRIAIATSQTSGAFYLIEGNKSTATFTTPADLTNYTYLWIYGIADGEIEINDIFIREVGLEPITTDIYLNEPLRKAGDYADYIDFINQKLIRNIGFKLLDGSEYWSLSNDSTNFRQFSATINNSENSSILADIFPAISISERNSKSGVVKYSGPAVRVSLFKSEYPDIITANDVKNWVTINNIKYYFRLTTPDDTEKIELPNIPTFKGKTVIEVDTSILPSNVELTYLGKE